MSFVGRYAELGDHEVSEAAMTAIVKINRDYVETKGKTFFARHLMLDNPLVSDGFINDTLEHFRRISRIGIARADEQQIEQSLRAMVALARVYLSIDYSDKYASNTHAHLAVAYLSGCVEEIVPHKMADVLMEGMRLMGQCADLLLAVEGPDATRTVVQKIGVISCVGVGREEYRPVTSTGVEQLARLSVNLLLTKHHGVQFAAREIRDNIKFIGKLLMSVPDTPLSSIHSTYLGPYYSASSTQGCSVRLSEIVNAVLNAPAEDVNARQVINNLESWADGMYQTEKELLLEAVKMRSHFTFDIVHWIAHVTKVLLAVANSAACDEHTKKKLRKHATWLISVLSFVPDDKGAVEFIEICQMTETLFESATDALSRGCAEVANDIEKLLLSWMFKAGRYDVGWAILERSVYGLTTLALLNDDVDSVNELKREITARLGAGGLTDKDARSHAAREIRGRAATLYREGHWSSAIERAMGQLDSKRLQPVLEDIADLISPETAGQAADTHFF